MGAAIPSMMERGTGGAIVLTSSTAGVTGIGGPTRGGLGYTAAKHGVVGLMRSCANNLAPYNIRVNTCRPTGVDPDDGQRRDAEVVGAGSAAGQRDVQCAPGRHGGAVDISNAILWLVSDDARYVTGVTLPVDAGFTNKK